MFDGYQEWFLSLLKAKISGNGSEILAGGRRGVVLNDIIRFDGDLSEDQQQTQSAFDFLWKDNSRFQDQKAQDALQEFYLENFGNIIEADWWGEYSDRPVLIDAGCGIGLSAINLFGERLRHLNYLGVDMTTSVENALRRFKDRNYSGAFIQCDLRKIPLPENCADLIFSQGVLHHTDNTKESLFALVKHLKPGGRVIFYVYRKKGPIREFTDDFIREKLSHLSVEEGWEKMTALTELGQALGQLQIDLDVPQDIDILGIPKGKIDLQRFFYWHIFKAFYRPDMTIEEMNHINFDWYAPKNAHRHTEEEIRGWMAELGFEVERLAVQPAGLGVIARKPR